MLPSNPELFAVPCRIRFGSGNRRSAGLLAGCTRLCEGLNPQSQNRYLGLPAIFGLMRTQPRQGLGSLLVALLNTERRLMRRRAAQAFSQRR
jgi:hypothetical protein